MKKIFLIIISILLLSIGGYFLFKGMIEPAIKKPLSLEELNLFEMTAEGVFEAGGYFSVDDVKVTYNGSEFIIENKSNNIYMITCGVYGKKQSGEYKHLATVSFVGVDEVQYEKDKKENGWAVKQYTNKVKPNETLVADLDVNGYISLSADVPDDFDVDADGYYDIAFMFSKQNDENSTTTSSDDAMSNYYKIKAK